MPKTHIKPKNGVDELVDTWTLRHSDKGRPKGFVKKSRKQLIHVLNVEIFRFLPHFLEKYTTNVLVEYHIFFGLFCQQMQKNLAVFRITYCPLICPLQGWKAFPSLDVIKNLLEYCVANLGDSFAVRL